MSTPKNHPLTSFLVKHLSFKLAHGEVNSIKLKIRIKCTQHKRVDTIKEVHCHSTIGCQG